MMQQQSQRQQQDQIPELPPLLKPDCLQATTFNPAPSHNSLQTWPENHSSSNPSPSYVPPAQTWNIKTDRERYLNKLEHRLSKVKQNGKISVSDIAVTDDEEDSTTTIDDDETTHLEHSNSKLKFYNSQGSSSSSKDYDDDDNDDDNESDQYNEGRQLLSPPSSVSSKHDFIPKNNSIDSSNSSAVVTANHHDESEIQEQQEQEVKLKQEQEQEQNQEQKQESGEATQKDKNVDNRQHIPVSAKIRFNQQVRIASGIKPRSQSAHNHHNWLGPSFMSTSTTTNEEHSPKYPSRSSRRTVSSSLLSNNNINNANNNANIIKDYNTMDKVRSMTPASSYASPSPFSTAQQPQPQPIAAIPRRLSTASNSASLAASRSSSPCSSIYAPLRAPSKLAPGPSRNITAASDNYMDFGITNIMKATMIYPDSNQDSDYLNLVTKQKRLRRLRKFHKRKQQLFKSTFSVSKNVWNTIKQPFSWSPVNNNNGSSSNLSSSISSSSTSNTPQPSTPINSTYTSSRKKHKLHVKSEDDVIWGPRPYRWFKISWWKWRFILAYKFICNLFFSCFIPQDDDDQHHVYEPV